MTKDGKTITESPSGSLWSDLHKRWRHHSSHSTFKEDCLTVGEVPCFLDVLSLQGKGKPNLWLPHIVFEVVCFISTHSSLPLRHMVQYFLRPELSPLSVNRLKRGEFPYAECMCFWCSTADDGRLILQLSHGKHVEATSSN